MFVLQVEDEQSHGLVLGSLGNSSNSNVEFLPFNELEKMVPKKYDLDELYYGTVIVIRL
jgi:hypothetical protein